MCGRFTLRTSNVELTSALDQLVEFPQLTLRYNIAPTQNVLSVRETHSENETDALEAVPLRWGLIPSWAKEIKIGARMINARSETIATKPSFRAAFKRRRCLILADGFYEWRTEGNEKLPFYITREDDQPFCMAGLWEHWSDEEQTIESCTIITTAANEFMSSIHDRMPVILNPASYQFWLDTKISDAGFLQNLILENEPDPLKMIAVSKLVNRASNDSPDCILPA